MRIVHLLQSSKFSGAENVVCQIIDLFKNNKDIEMIYVSPDGPIRETLYEKKISFYPLKNFKQREINRAFAELKPDLIHAHDFNASVRSSIQKKIRVISHLHSNPKWLSKVCFYSIAYGICSIRYEKILGVSNSILDEFIFSRSINEKFVSLPNVVDAIKIEDMSREKIDYQIDILYVGRLSKPKNPIGFLKIIKKIVNCYEKEISVVMLGEGFLLNECHRFISENELENCVKIIGFDSNPYKYMNAAKILIIPSIYEGFGLVAVESMLLGTVVLATPVGGLKGIIQNGGGELCEKDDDFVEKAIHYLTNNSERKSMERKAKQVAKKYTDLERYKKTIKDIYFRASGSSV